MERRFDETGAVGFVVERAITDVRPGKGTRVARHRLGDCRKQSRIGDGDVAQRVMVGLVSRLALRSLTAWAEEKGQVPV